MMNWKTIGIPRCEGKHRHIWEKLPNGERCGRCRLHVVVEVRP